MHLKPRGRIQYLDFYLYTISIFASKAIEFLFSSLPLMEPPNEVPSQPISVVILPLPAQGHLNQLLHLARLVTARDIAVHYVGSSTHNRQARDRIHGWDPTTNPNLHFHDFPLPSFPTPPPNPNSPNKFPSHLLPAFEATVHLSSPLSSLLQSLSSSSRRVVLIHDSNMSFAASFVDSLPNAEAFVFHSVPAITLIFFFLERRGQPTNQMLSFRPKLSFEDCFTEEFLAFLRRQHRMAEKCKGRLINTSRCIEAEFIDRLGLEPSWQGQKLFAIGPINPLALEEANSSRRHECLDWLDRQPPMSVVYVSFGTTTSLSLDQILELASGLKSSGQRYVWVLRDADRGDIYAPEEKDRLADVTGGCDRGLVARGWAPQPQILAHAAVGGFLSHCGWNSCMESLSSGVPMLTWPMHSDQPWNSILVTEVLKVGIVMRDWAKRSEILPATAISDSITMLMDRDEGKEIRKRAQAIAKALREAVADGGTSREEFDSFIDYITS